MTLKPAIFIMLHAPYITDIPFSSTFKTISIIDSGGYLLRYEKFDDTFKRFFYNSNDHVFCGKDTN